MPHQVDQIYNVSTRDYITVTGTARITAEVIAHVQHQARDGLDVLAIPEFAVGAKLREPLPLRYDVRVTRENAR